MFKCDPGIFRSFAQNAQRNKFLWFQSLRF